MSNYYDRCSCDGRYFPVPGDPNKLVCDTCGNTIEVSNSRSDIGGTNNSSVKRKKSKIKSILGYSLFGWFLAAFPVYGISSLLGFHLPDILLMLLSYILSVVLLSILTFDNPLKRLVFPEFKCHICGQFVGGLHSLRNVGTTFEPLCGLCKRKSDNNANTPQNRLKEHLENTQNEPNFEINIPMVAEAVPTALANIDRNVSLSTQQIRKSPTERDKSIDVKQNRIESPDKDIFSVRTLDGRAFSQYLHTLISQCIKEGLSPHHSIKCKCTKCNREIELTISILTKGPSLGGIAIDQFVHCCHCKNNCFEIRTQKIMLKSAFEKALLEMEPTIENGIIGFPLENGGFEPNHPFKSVDSFNSFWKSALPYIDNFGEIKLSFWFSNFPSPQNPREFIYHKDVEGLMHYNMRKDTQLIFFRDGQSIYWYYVNKL